MKRKVLSLLLCLAPGLSLLSQSLVGSIRNARSQEAIPFVNIGLRGTSFGFISDENGQFTFRVTSEKDTDTMLVSSIGFKPLMLTVAQMRSACDNKQPILLEETVYQLQTTTVKPDEYIKKTVGQKSVADLECINLSGVAPTDTATLRKFKEKGLSEKAIGVEIGNKISIKSGHQTFIDHVQFKTCQQPGDTAIYRVNIYSEGKTLERVITPLGVVKRVTTNNVMRQPIIIKTIGKTEVHDIDLSAQNIEVSDDFIIALECIYSSNRQMNIGAKANVFGSTDLLVRESIVDEWIKIPLIDLTFVSATVLYKKKK